jgi:hypothetical protein
VFSAGDYNPIANVICVALLVMLTHWVWRRLCREMDDAMDPVGARRAISVDELLLAEQRLRWVDGEARRLARRVGVVKTLAATEFCNVGAHYSPLEHRIRVSRALCARLRKPLLTMLIAHEVGHARLRWGGLFHWNRNVDLEIRCDRIALSITGQTPSDWMDTFVDVVEIECAVIDSGLYNEFRCRAAAIGANDVPRFLRGISVGGRPRS